MFRFILGMVTGVAIGVAAANMSSTESGRDLRAEFERIRADIEKRDFEALGAHLEERFKELQAMLEKRFAEVEEAANQAAVEAEEAAADKAQAAKGSHVEDSVAAVRATAAIIARVNDAAGRHPPQGSGAINSIGAVPALGRPWLAHAVRRRGAG